MTEKMKKDDRPLEKVKILGHENQPVFVVAGDVTIEIYEENGEADASYIVSGLPTV